VEKFFSESLICWDQELNPRTMPWKGEKDPYRIWLSEIILQQTRVEQGLPYYLRFIAAFPDIRTLEAAGEAAVFRLWQGLGYYSRCKNLLATARRVVNEYQGVFPCTYPEILGLPGIGPYTAAAIASFAFDLPYAVVDGNVVRVLSRYFGVNEAADTSAGKAHFTELATKLLDKSQPATYNQAIMDFGARICKPRQPSCNICPIQVHCLAYRDGRVKELPVKSRRPAVRDRHFNYLVISYQGRLYLHLRTQKDIWQNLYEFPLIETAQEVTAGELLDSPDFRRLLHGVKYRVLHHTDICRQQLTHRRIFARFTQIEAAAPVPALEGYILVFLKDLHLYALPGIIVSILQEKFLTLSVR